MLVDVASAAVSRPRRSKLTVPERSFKAELVRQSLEPGASVSAIALAGGVNANLLFKWRRDHLRASMASSAAQSSTVLLPVHVASGGDDGDSPQWMSPPVSAQPAMPAHRTVRGGVIELDIAGAQLRLRGPVDEASLCSVLRALRQST